MELSMEQDGGYTAFCFDEACQLFGETVVAAMEDAKGKTEKQRRGNAENILRTYLGMQKKFRGIEEIGKAGRKARPDPPFPMET